MSLVLCEATNQTKALPYAMSADILMADPYPIGRAGDNVSAVVEATDAVVDLIARAEGEDGRHRLAIMVPQARLACPAEIRVCLLVACPLPRALLTPKVKHESRYRRGKGALRAAC